MCWTAAIRSPIFEQRRGKFENVRFDDVFHHAADATFMTYRMTGTDVATGEAFAKVGVERYTFRDGKLTVKDVYSARPKLSAQSHQPDKGRLGHHKLPL